jgi:hypothetical protein
LDYIYDKWAYESLILKIHAGRAGWTAVESPFYPGKSGVRKFSFLAKDGTDVCGFDICEDACEEDVRKSYEKKKDTGVYTVIISLSGRPRKEVAQLADDCGISIFSPANIDSFFSLSNDEMKNPPDEEPLDRKEESNATCSRPC